MQKGLNFGVILFIVSEALFFMAIFWAFFHSALWIETKLRGSPKTLITKLYKETFKVALLIIKGIVRSLEIIGINQWMGNRGSKSDSLISVKEQRVDGFSTPFRCGKVYSKCQGNLVFMHNNYVFNLKMCFYPFYSYKVRYSSYATSSKLNPYYVSGFTDGEGCFFVGVSPDSKYKTKLKVKAIFQVGVHIKDIALLEEMKLFFNVGNISKLIFIFNKNRRSRGETVWLRFILTQHLRDKDLLESIISTLGCGRYITKSGYGEIIVEKFSDVYGKIIPMFDEFKLQGIKSKEFEDFKKAALIIKDKTHLTREGLDEVKKK